MERPGETWRRVKANCDKGLKEAVEDEKCNRISKEGEADESVLGNNIEAEVAAEGSIEDYEDGECVFGGEH